MPPAPTVRVNDYGQVLSSDDRARLERVLADGERETAAQIVVAIFPSLEGESLEDFSIRLAEKWRIGRKALDDGVIILVFPKERRLRIEVGYGLEGAIPDIEAARVIREVIAPPFREGRIAAGLEAGARALYARIERLPPEQRRGSGRGQATSLPVWGIAVFLGILGVIAAMLFHEAATTRGVTRGYSAGRRGWGVPPVIMLPPMGRRDGGFGGGGFGGFSGGGGRFGGGGASGDW